VTISEVKGKKITITESLFTTITRGLKCEGARIMVGEKCSFLRYNKMEFY